MALGALIGGLLLAGTEYRREVELTIDPFKGLLVGVFLISVGMGLDLAKMAAAPATIMGAAAGLIACKLAVTAAIARSFGIPWLCAMQTGMLLGPAGEFSFVILIAGASAGLLPDRVEEAGRAVIALTMAMIPLLSALGNRVARLAGPGPTIDLTLLGPLPRSVESRVLIAGFGRVGQMVAALLDAHHVPYIAIDRNPDHVAEQRGRGKSVYYGDMTKGALLHRLELRSARALVVTMDEHRVVDELVAAARAERADLLIVARARDVRHAAHLYRVGASDAVPETVEASLQLAEALLVDLGVPMGPAIASIHAMRAEVQASLKAMAPEAEIRQLGRRRLREALQTNNRPDGRG
jgi:CPA2 family monovalent cation:H+ antiporter-2